MPVLLKDTLTTQPVNENATPNPGSNFTTIDGETRNTAGMTPYRVLQELRPDATEDQKDSAIQAHFKVGDIAYNTRTDTMTTFGIRVLKVKPFEKTHFMDTTYFHGGKYFHPELGLPRVGVAGDPAPYLLRNDNTITSLLLGCFLLAMFSFSFSKNLFLQQLKNFFFVPRSVAEMTETALERRFQWFFILQTAMLLGIIYYVYQAFYLHTDFVIDSQLALIALFAGFFTLYFGVKYGIYKFVNWVFFHRQNNEQWNRSWRLLSATEGVLLFPLVLLVVYFDLPLPSAFIYTASIIVLVKILTFYKSFTIFFSQSNVHLQIILYFCALELMPIVTSWGILEMIASVFAIKLGMVAFYVLAAFDARLAICNCDVLQAYIVSTKERALASERFVLYLFHNFLLSFLICYFCLQNYKNNAKVV